MKSSAEVAITAIAGTFSVDCVVFVSMFACFV